MVWLAFFTLVKIISLFSIKQWFYKWNKLQWLENCVFAFSEVCRLLPSMILFVNKKNHRVFFLFFVNGQHKFVYYFIYLFSLTWQVNKFHLIISIFNFDTLVFFVILNNFIKIFIFNFFKFDSDCNNFNLY